MECSVISLFFVLIISISAQQNLYRDLLGSFGTVLDSKNIFLKTVVSTITAPFRLPENQQSMKSRSPLFMTSPAGLIQQSGPLNIPASLGSDISVFGQPVSNAQLLEYNKRQMSPGDSTSPSDEVSASVKRAMYLNDPPGDQKGNVAKDALSTLSQSDIPMLIRLLSGPQAKPESISLSNDQIAEILTSLLKLLAQKYNEIDTKVPLEGQTTAAGNAETAPSPSSPLPLSTSSIPVENTEQSTPSSSLPDHEDNSEQSTS